MKEIPIDDWYANVFAYSDIDVTLEIFKCLENHPFAYVFNHIKGHQDDKIPYHKLSRPSQLNVQADELATEALRDQQWDHTPIFFPMPNCKVYLKSQGIYQCNHELVTCRTAIPLQQSKSYFKRRYQWTEHVYDLIDWNAFRNTRKRMDIIHTFVTKLVTGWLPVHHRQARMENIPARCPLCPEDETVDHMAQCPSRNNWKQDFQTRFSKLLKNQQTCPTLQHELLQASSQWMSGEHHDLSTDPQALIGWNLFHRGLLAKAWGERQIYFARTTRPTTLIDRKGQEKLLRWPETIIQFIWMEMHQMWKTRCEWVHRKNEQHESTQAQIRASSAVRALYQHADEIGYQDRRIFAMPLQERLQHSPRDLFAWVSSMQPAVLQARKEYLIRSTENTHDIREFFEPLEPRFEATDHQREPSKKHTVRSDHNYTT